MCVSLSGCSSIYTADSVVSTAAIAVLTGLFSVDVTVCAWSIGRNKVAKSKRTWYRFIVWMINVCDCFLYYYCKNCVYNTHDFDHYCASERRGAYYTCKWVGVWIFLVITKPEFIVKVHVQH